MERSLTEWQYPIGQYVPKATLPLRKSKPLLRSSKISYGLKQTLAVRGRCKTAVPPWGLDHPTIGAPYCRLAYALLHAMQIRLLEDTPTIKGMQKETGLKKPLMLQRCSGSECTYFNRSSPLGLFYN